MSPHSPPPRWLMVVLMGCLSLLLVFFLTRAELTGFHAGAFASLSSPVPEPVVVPSASAAPTPAPVPTPEPSPEPTPEPDWSLPVPLGEAVDQKDWFADAAFIGDSRIDGLRLYSGITSDASFLVHTGLSVYDVQGGKKVVRSGADKLSVLDALALGTYGKIYISLGVNELGYRAPQDFAETYGQIIDSIRELQPGARLYIQSIPPVNSEKCRANDVPYYVTNEAVSRYNQVLPALCLDKKVRLLDVPDALRDAQGESPAELSADGVHFKKKGYGLWLDYLTTHTGTASESP